MFQCNMAQNQINGKNNVHHNEKIKIIFKQYLVFCFLSKLMIQLIEKCHKKIVSPLFFNILSKMYDPVNVTDVTLTLLSLCLCQFYYSFLKKAFVLFKNWCHFSWNLICIEGSTLNLPITLMFFKVMDVTNFLINFIFLTCYHTWKGQNW